jgi:hypothetical protein
MTLPLSEFPVGSLWKRAEIHGRLGGNIQRGISAAAGKPYILIFSGPSGEAYGYETAGTKMASSTTQGRSRSAT